MSSWGFAATTTILRSIFPTWKGMNFFFARARAQAHTHTHTHRSVKRFANGNHWPHICLKKHSSLTADLCGYNNPYPLPAIKTVSLSVIHGPFYRYVCLCVWFPLFILPFFLRVSSLALSERYTEPPSLPFSQLLCRLRSIF